jgi:hypothetical protein
VQQLDDRVAAAGVAAAAALTGIDERAEPAVREEARPAGPDLPQQLLHDAAGEAVRLDLVLADELLHPGRPGEVRGDHPAQHAFVGETVRPHGVAVAEPERVHEGQVARMAGLEKALLEGREDGLGGDHAGPVAADGDGVGVVDEPRGLGRAQEPGDGHGRLAPPGRR